MEKEGKKVLVVVHPGSACGSADFNLGDVAGSNGRHALCRTMHTWEDRAVVIDGNLSDEIARYPQVDIAIQNLLERAPGSTRVNADPSDAEWTRRAREAVSATGASKALLTGAWHHLDNDDGCVNHMAKALQSEGIEVEILPCALTL